MPSFLSPILRTSAERFWLRNTRTGTSVADRLLTAFDSRSRNIGLLRHDSLPVGSALIIAPTGAIHTFFMKFPIDVAFVAKDGRVVKARTAVKPWRITFAFRAYAVVEMPAGALNRSDTRAHDRVELVERIPADT